MHLQRRFTPSHSYLLWGVAWLLRHVLLFNHCKLRTWWRDCSHVSHVCFCYQISSVSCEQNQVDCPTSCCRVISAFLLTVFSPASSASSASSLLCPVHFLSRATRLVARATGRCCDGHSNFQGPQVVAMARAIRHSLHMSKSRK